MPSKFFASLAVGRPVLYAGPADSEIARWIAEHDLGFRVTDGTTDAVADRLHALLDDDDALARCAKGRSPSTGGNGRRR